MPLPEPVIDPTAIFELFRGRYATELLTAAVSHFDLFVRLANQPRNLNELRIDLNLEERPVIVLTTALRAMGLLGKDSSDRFVLTELSAEHLVRGQEFDVGSYLSLAATTPGVIEMTERLQSNRPAGLSGDGVAFIYRDGMKSAMETTKLAEHFTLALGGRAKNVAPVLANRVSLDGVTTLLDVGGGTGIYSLAFLLANPDLRVTVLDRPEVLKTAERIVVDHGVQDRMTLHSADMFVDPLPKSDAILLSNILHDWDVTECQQLILRCADSLNPGGKLIVHDVLLNDDLDGPLPIALYSAALFTMTEGRAYSAQEYSMWLRNAGLQPAAPISTLIHCHAIVASLA